MTSIIITVEMPLIGGGCQEALIAWLAPCLLCNRHIFSYFHLYFWLTFVVESFSCRTKVYFPSFLCVGEQNTAGTLSSGLQDNTHSIASQGIQFSQKSNSNSIHRFQMLYDRQKKYYLF